MSILAKFLLTDVLVFSADATLRYCQWKALFGTLKDRKTVATVSDAGVLSRHLSSIPDQNLLYPSPTDGYRRFLRHSQYEGEFLMNTAAHTSRSLTHRPEMPGGLTMSAPCRKAIMS